jgi:hypothetical protein
MTSASKRSSSGLAGADSAVIQVPSLAAWVAYR